MRTAACEQEGVTLEIVRHAARQASSPPWLYRVGHPANLKRTGIPAPARTSYNPSLVFDFARVRRGLGERATREEVKDRGRAYLVLVALLLVLGVPLRVLALDAPCLWADEVRTARLAQLPVAELLPAILEQREDGPPLQHLLTKLALRFGSGDAYVRAPSVVAGLLGILGLFALGRRAYGSGVALLAAFFLATSHLHIYYSHEARPYALWVLVTTLLLLAYSHAVRTDTRRSWILVGALGATCYYTHILSVFPLAALALAFLTSFARRFRVRPSGPSPAGGASSAPPLRLRRALLGLGVALLLLAPVIPPTLALFSAPMGAGHENFLRPESAGSIALWRAPHSAELQRAFGAGSWTALAGLALLAGVGLARAFRVERSMAWAYAWMFALPVLVLFARPVGHGFAGKYLIYWLPALCLLQASGLWTLARRLPRRAQLPATLLASAALAGLQLGAHGERFGPPVRDWRGAAEAIAQRYDAQPVLCLTSATPARPPLYDLASECLGYYLPSRIEVATARALTPAARVALGPTDGEPTRSVCALVQTSWPLHLPTEFGVEVESFDGLAVLHVARPGYTMSEQAALLLAAAADQALYLPETDALLSSAIALMRHGSTGRSGAEAGAASRHVLGVLRACLERKIAQLNPATHAGALARAGERFAELARLPAALAANAMAFEPPALERSR